MTDPETPDEVYDRLLRETRLSERIRWLEAGLGNLRLCVLSTPEVMLLIDQLRELRARRIAAGREPDDEVNAAADLCCCGPLGSMRLRQREQAERIREAFGCCPLHPQPTVREKVDEAIRRVRSREHDGSTGAEFLEAAREALGGGLELREDMGFCLGCGCRDCCCPAVTVLGPRLRCGAFRLRDCGGISSCETLCEPADEAFPF